jgi:hypothetical protein
MTSCAKNEHKYRFFGGGRIVVHLLSKILIMRKITLLLALAFSNFLFAQNNITAYQQLASVNEQWKNQTDVSATLKNTETKPLAEHQLQQFHLQETELLLRSRNVSQLSPSLKKQRAKNLDILHSYWQRGLFPVNEMHEGRQPYFIDKVNTYCAVGYLMQKTGGDAIAKEIKATQNFSYLLDIHHPKLMNWVVHSGLSLDELALIQLPYFGPAPCLVTEMHYNNTGTDVNEYIEIRQAFSGATTMLPFDKILFYDQTNTLYKTLDISQMQTSGSGGPGGLYYYNFPANENFSDVGYFEIINSIPSSKVLSKITYNQNVVAYDRLNNDVYVDGNPTYVSKIFSVGESESAPIGSSLTFCGILGGGAWTLQPNAESRAAVNSCLVLPILLSKFEYTLKENTVTLSWQTQSEINSDYFDIEKSIDGIKFEKIGQLKASGSSSTAKDYSFIDNKPNYINHYRLKQLDLNGKILFVKVQQASAIKIIENPVKKNLQLQLGIDASKIKSITIFDFMGRQLKTIKANSGLHNVDVSNFSIGKYLVQMITTDGQGYNISFIKAE